MGQARGASHRGILQSSGRGSLTGGLFGGLPRDSIIGMGTPAAAEARASLLRDVAMISNQSDDPSQALPAAIQLVCRYTGWPVGIAYLAGEEDPSVFSYAGIRWVEPSSPLAPMADLIAVSGFRAGQGLLGQVAEAGVPAWVPHLRDRDRLPPEAVPLGLESAFIIPILTGVRAGGVLEFLIPPGDRPESSYLDAIAMVGTQIGRVVERRAVEREIADIAMREQRMIGRDLHDGLGQQVAGLGMIARSLHRRLEQRKDPEAAAAARLLQGLEEAKSQLRMLARGLTPVEVDAEGLMSALADLAEGVEEAADVHCTFRCQETVHITNNFRATHLFRIAQEAVNNAVRHGNPSQVDVRLRLEDTRLLLEIEDDGCGMKGNPAQADGLGIRNMTFRARLIQGNLDFRTSAKGGVLVSCDLDL